MKSRSHHEAMAEQFRTDSDYAGELLAEVIRDGDLAELTILLRQLAEAFGEEEMWKLVDAHLRIA